MMYYIQRSYIPLLGISKHNYFRSLHSSCYLFAKSSETKESMNIIYKAKLDSTKPENLATFAYNYFKELEKRPNPILTAEYKQLPDDSQFIDKHYTELVKYRDLLCGVGGQFVDIPEVSEMFFKLSKLHPLNGTGKKNNNAVHDTHRAFLKLQAEQFDQFIIDLMSTMKLNGGHLFVLDLLIYNKQVFDHCESVHHTV